jgi:hypothetical protein
MSSAKRRFCEVEKGTMRMDSAIGVPPRSPSLSSSTRSLILHDGPVSGSIAETFFFVGKTPIGAERPPEVLLLPKDALLRRHRLVL